MINKQIIPEILAPCGSYEILKAAVHAGADACYVGGHKFGARAYATNFDDNSIIDAVEFAHINGCRLYLTVNTLFKDNEINELYDYVLPFYEHGLDAVIVQDFGVFDFIKKHFPDMKIHCSTQMNITSCHGAALMKKNGASRIVTARELSLSEIKNIKASVDIELETFVHGAMCYSYSGQCLMSSLAGGRSGNRGRCAQPCRKKYNGEYLLSMKDMCLLENIPKLIDAGIDSFKIEGRMKNEYYVASSVSAYKELVSDYLAGSFSEKKAAELKFKLANVYNRGGFCDGYFFSTNGEKMISRKKPNHQGVCIGRLVSVYAGKLLLKLSEALYKNDVLEIILKDETIINITSNISASAGDTVSLNAPKTKDIVEGQDIFRTKSYYIEESVQGTPEKQRLCGVFNGRVGEALSFEVSGFIKGKPYTGKARADVVAVSNNKMADKAVIMEKLCQLGNTNYSFKKIDIYVDDNSFIPLGALKKLRREAIENFEKNIVDSFYRRAKKNETNLYNIKNSTEAGKKINPYSNTGVGVLTVNQLRTALDYDGVKNIYVDFGLYNNYDVKNIIKNYEKSAKKFYLCLPDVINNDFDITKYLPNKDISGIYIKNTDGLACALELEDSVLAELDLVCGPTVYVYNIFALNFLSSLCNRLTFTLGMELNKKELLDFTKKIAAANYNIIMYGHTRVMLSKQCVKKTMGKCDNVSEITKITDELGNSFYCHNECNGCYNKIYNRDALNLLDKLSIEALENLNINGIMLDFTIEDKKRVKKVLDYAFGSDDMHQGLDFPVTTGHLNRGVE